MNYRTLVCIFALALLFNANVAAQQSVAVPPPQHALCLAKIQEAKKSGTAPTKTKEYCDAEAKAAQAISNYNTKSSRGGDLARNNFLREVQAARAICAAWKGSRPDFCGELLKLPPKLNLAATTSKK